MTIIVANRECMAADSLVTDDQITYHTDKIFVVGDYLVGMAGGVRECATFLEWFRAGRPSGAEPLGRRANFCALALSKKGLFYFEDTTIPDALHDPFHAIGAGSQAALAAMHLGKTPTEAAEVACLVAASCGAPVKTLRLSRVKAL